VVGALATTDAEGSEGSEAGDAKALGGAVVDKGGARSCGCFEQAANPNNNANDKRNGADFMGGAFIVLDATSMPRAGPAASC
jgi:hypothetical protein